MGAGVCESASLYWAVNCGCPMVRGLECVCFFFVLSCMSNTRLFPACTLHFQWLRCRGVVAGVCESASLYLAAPWLPHGQVLACVCFFASLLCMSKTRLFPACIFKHAQFQWLRCRGCAYWRVCDGFYLAVNLCSPMARVRGRVCFFRLFTLYE